MHLRANPRNLESVARSPIPTLESGGREALTLHFPDNPFGCKLGVRLGQGSIPRHDAGCRLAFNEGAWSPNRSHGRAPIPRSAVISNNRILRYVGHVASEGRPRAHKRGDVNGWGDENAGRAARGATSHLCTW